MITAILFDIDGVLLDSYETNYLFLLEIAKTAGFPEFDKEKFKLTTHMTYIDAVRFLSGVKDTSQDSLFWKLLKEIPYREKELSRMPKGEKETIIALARKYKLGIVTSRVRIGAESYFGVSELEKYFSAVVCFEDYKKPKPDPEPLLIALKRLGEKAENCVYVGDSQSDFEAAQRAGMKFIAYTEISGKPTPGAKVECRSFRELWDKLSKAEVFNLV